MGTNSKHATHTKYSDFVIFAEIERFRSGKYKFKTEAFRAAGKKLGLRREQATAQYYFQVSQGKTIDDFKDFTEQDKLDFYPGSGEPVNQSPRASKVERPKYENGYEHSNKDLYDDRASKKLGLRNTDEKKPIEMIEHPNNAMGQQSHKVILTENEDKSYNVHLHDIKQAVKSLTRNTPSQFRKELIQELLNGL